MKRFFLGLGSNGGTGWFGSALLGAALAVASACGVADKSSSSSDEGTSSGTSCKADDDCAEGEVCDPLLDECAECLFDADCDTGQICNDKKCEEPCDTNRDCSGTRSLCNRARGACVECDSTSDCGSHEMCVSNACERYVTCESDDDCNLSGGRCLSAYSSDPFGGGGETLPTGRCVDCTSTSDCRGADQVCVRYSCEDRCTSDRDCESTSPPGLCASDGYGRHCVECQSDNDCPSVYHCNPAKNECELDQCKDGHAECASSRELRVCNNGSYSIQSCTSGDCIDDADGEGVCPVCDPDQKPQCSGSRLTTCAKDGSKYIETDCSDASKACSSSEGKCVDINEVCDAGASYCKDGNVWQCDSQGISEYQSSTCTSDTKCTESGSSAYCESLVCAPGTAICSGNEVRECLADGSAYASSGTDCDTDVCVNGVCMPKVCEAYEYFCQSGDLYRCNDNGTDLALYDHCTGSYVCITDASYCGQAACCGSPICTPGAPACDGLFATTCNGDGSDYDAGGTDCSLGGQVCLGGDCVDSCNPYETYCQDGDVWQCQGDGATRALSNACTGTTECVDDGFGSASCLDVICTPTEDVCVGDMLMVCDSTGTGYEAGGTNCNDTNEVCVDTGTPACVANAIDTVGGTTTVITTTSARLVGNFYRIDTSRTLIEIEMNLAYSANNDVTWVVYQASSESGTYSQLDSGLIPLVGTSTGDWVPSGAISVALTAGYYYFIGFYLETDVTYYRNATQPDDVSFGQSLSGEALGAVSLPTTVNTTAAASYAYYQRLTTDEP